MKKLLEMSIKQQMIKMPQTPFIKKKNEGKEGIYDALLDKYHDQWEEREIYKQNVRAHIRMTRPRKY